MSGHTPGPWRASPWSAAEMAVNATVDGKPFLVAGYSLPADAKLIAAAPELLAALEQFVAEYVELVESGDAGFWSAEDEAKVIKARAAIAKATGAA